MGWLAEFILESGQDIEFPAELARDLASKIAVHNKQPTYYSLETRLSAQFENMLAALPPELQAVTSEEFSQFGWDSLSPAQRRAFAKQRDCKIDPARSGEHNFWWRHFAREQEVERKLAEWQAISAPDAGSLNVKEANVAKWQRELADLKTKFASIPDLLLIRYSVGQAETCESKTQYVPYPTAFSPLNERFDTSPEEIAMWIWLGAHHNGLRAFVNPGALGAPPRFTFAGTDGWDYVSKIMGCWFRLDDLEHFVPTNRYIRCDQLRERWRGKQGIDSDANLDAFIRAKIVELRLDAISPITGPTQWEHPGNPQWPPIESAMFRVAQIEEIEANDFPNDTRAASAQGWKSKPVPAWKIMQVFSVFPNEDKNALWWNPRLRDAKKYGLIECRASLGQRGISDSSTWYPDGIAGWLIDKNHVAPSRVVRLLRDNFDDCVDIADRLDPSK